MYGYGFGYTNSKIGKTNAFTKSDCSYYFDGSNNYLDMGKAAQSLLLGSNKQWSIRILFRPLTGSKNCFGLSIWNTTGQQRAISLNLDSNTLGGNKLFLGFSSSGSSVDGNFTSTGTINDNDWNDVVITYDAGSVNVYLNGVSFAGISTTIPTTIFSSSANTLIGAVNAGNNVNEASYINMVSIANEIWTVTDAANMWNNGTPRLASEVASDVVNEWYFDTDTFDGTNFTVIDTVGSDNGTSSGMISSDKDCNENPY